MSKRKILSKYALRLAALVGVAFLMGWRPGFSAGRIHAVSREIAAVESTVAANSSSSEVVDAAREAAFNDIDSDNRCESISEQDRLILQKDSGLDLVAFVEESTRAMNQARTAEEQLQVVGTRFDHRSWSKAWGANDAAAALGASEREKQIRELLRVQTSLSHVSMFLTRYHRIFEAGVRQEASALRAFRWDVNAQQEMKREPVRALVRGYLPHICSKDDAAQYGCRRGETMYRVKALLSPRLSCRFPDKKPYYAAVFWVRMSGVGAQREARILEIEANGDRLARMTFDDVTRKGPPDVLTSGVSEVLIDAGLDPFRTPVIWRRLLQVATPGAVADGRRPASD